MTTINIKQLVGTMIVITTEDMLESNIEAKLSATLLKVVQSAQNQHEENLIESSGKSEQQQSSPQNLK